MSIWTVVTDIDLDGLGESQTTRSERDERTIDKDDEDTRLPSERLERPRPIKR